MIGVQIEDENRVLIERLADQHGCINKFLGMIDDGKTACLRFIDEYGDTTFNRAQIKVLRAEISAALASASIDRLRHAREHELAEAIRLGWQQSVVDELREGIGTESSSRQEAEEVRLFMDGVLQLLDRAYAKGPHHYVRFVGD